MSEPTAQSSGRGGVGWVMLTCGALGAFAAAALLVEKIRSLEDPAYIPTCNLSPIIACGSVMNSDQAEALGFPNPVLGLAGFAALSTLGALVATRSPLPRWMWSAAQGGLSFAVVFVHWLIFQSIFRLGALCPYCMVVWAITIIAFVEVTRHNLNHPRRPLPPPIRALRTLLTNWHGVVITTWLLAICAVILKHFWWYWSSL